MGGSPSKHDGLQRAVTRAESRSGKLTVSGRYHHSPKRIEDDYIISRKVLGTGYNGSVFLAQGRLSNITYAVKAFNLNGISGDKLSDLETEAEIFLSMDHPHVARLVDVYEDQRKLHLVMECMEGGELFERVIAKKRFREADAAKAISQMLLAVNYIHFNNVVHRDLKLDNFLYCSKGSDHLKLIDFGFSHVWEANTVMALSCGTLAYVAPEVLARSYTSQCDLWSMGVISFILLAGYMPFNGSEECQVAAISRGQWTHRPERWAGVSRVARDFVDKLLVVDPNERMTAAVALEHQFLTSTDMDSSQEDPVDGEIVRALTDFAEATKFRRVCMSMMAWSLTNVEREKVRLAFMAMDKNKRGTITMGELKRALTQEFDITDDEIRPIFEALDGSNNEVIHYTEFLAAMVSTRIAMHDDLLAETFRRFDVDASGYITVENLRTVLGESFDGVEVNKLIKEADFKNDNRISYDEFMQYLKGGQAESSQLDAANVIIDEQIRKTVVHGHDDRPLIPADGRVVEEERSQRSKSCILL